MVESVEIMFRRLASLALGAVLEELRRGQSCRAGHVFDELLEIWRWVCHYW